MIAEFAPRGALDARLVLRLRHDVLAALAHGCAGVIISGGDLRYRGVEGLAQFGALVDDLAVQFPWVPVWLAHLAPDLLAALHLANMANRWHIAPDRASALEALSAFVSEVPDGR
jgi:hypothetical protein